jgi:hypothetical protein
VTTDPRAWAKALTALVLAIITAIAAAIGNGSLDDLDTSGWVKVALVILGGSALTQFVENVVGAFGGVIKALMGAATAGLTAWTVAYENDLPGLHQISQGEWLTISIAVITALAAVYQIPDGPDPAVEPVVVDDTRAARVR